MKKGVPGERVNLPAEPTLVALISEEKVDPPARANSTHACSDCLALTELTRLGEPKCLHGESWPG